MTVYRFICNIDFQASIKYQDAIIFEIQNVILKELGEIYKLNIATTYLELYVKRNGGLKVYLQNLLTNFKKVPRRYYI